MNDALDDRPDPDALLKRVQAEEQREKRAKLRIYFGYAPGVGKTYKMLEAARELRAGGVDVVIGLVETHGRYDTAAQLLGLEVLPRRVVEHRGRKLEEFDLDAALTRRPQLLILDELPHTNVPGSRHDKRWQDVEEILAAGIDVHTTLNVQHVESLNDVVAQITTIRVRETVPDTLLDRADEIELVDLPPGELLTRLKQGKVYFPDQAERAARNFFQRGNLLALRELALRRTADRVDVDVQAHREQHEIDEAWATAERILVCIGPSPASARLVRAAKRMAAGLRASWVAAYVDAAGIAPLSETDSERLDAHLRLAESLGAEVERLQGSQVSSALLDYARSHHVTRIVIGKPTHARLRDLLRGSLLTEVVRGSGDIDVHVISGDLAPTVAQLSTPQKKPIEGLGEHVWAALWVVLATGLARVGRAAFELPDVAMLYVAAIMVVASRFGRGPSLLAAILSVAAYDFFFVPPFLTFSVADTQHFLTFGVMLGVGILISTLTLRIRRQEQGAREREIRTASLYALSRELGGAVDEVRISDALATHAAKVFGSGVAVMLLHGADDLKEAARVGNIVVDTACLGVARWVVEHQEAAGLGMATLPGAKVVCSPLSLGPKRLGVIALSPDDGRRLRLDELELLDAFVRQGTSAIERVRLSEEAKAASLRARTEEMRSSLLSAVSHDLRTPLAAITGAATTLRDAPEGSLTSVRDKDLLQAICEEAERLERLVGNLLDMMRLDSGSLHIKREWVPLEEMVGSALARLQSKLTHREVKTRLAADLPLLAVDQVLFEQVFINLLENAAKYAPTGPIEVSAAVDAGLVVIDVADRGPGLPTGAEQRIFEKFFRGSGTGTAGVGLGLSICRGIVEAHGGTIRAQNRPGGGALFRITMPVPPDSPRIEGMP
jgi:two-component system sensor histidine kinase KdpD